jgi:hypothetical protein
MLSETTMAQICRNARTDLGGRIPGTINLDAAGLLVQVLPAHAGSSGLEPGRAYKIVAAAGVAGENTFMRLRTLHGDEVPCWHRAAELKTAPHIEAFRMPHMLSAKNGEIMNNAAAERFQKRVTQLAGSGEPWARAIRTAAHEDELGARAYHVSTTTAAGVTPERALSLSATVEAKATSGADFDALVGAFQAETNCGWAHAVRVVGARFPKLAARR